MTRGCFITFEGLDGAGKSSHIARTAQRLQARGRQVIVTREPGGTPLGERLRELVLSHPMHLETETLLMFAARREHVATVIEPALARGAWVVCDRFTDATRAYQGGGRGVDADKIEILARWVHPDLQPDLTLLFDLAPEIAKARISGQRQLDRFELEKADFHAKVRGRYLELARGVPRRFRVLDAALSEGDIDKALEEIIIRL